MLLHGATIRTFTAPAHWLNAALSIWAFQKQLPLAAPAVQLRAAGTGMGLGGILERRATVQASLPANADGTGTGTGASAAGLTRATSRRLGGLGPRLLPHDARQAGDADAAAM